jgi:hypothetical protein
MLTYTYLKTKPKEFLSATGLYVAEFDQLLPVFTEAYRVIYPATQTYQGKPRQRAVGGGRKGVLGTMADKLLFILVYEKTYPLQTMQGLHFGLSQARTNYWVHHLLPVLRQALAQLDLTPEREAHQVASRLNRAPAPADLVLDGTERRRQRPRDPERQVAYYSGKKKAHTDKNLLLVNMPLGQVTYLSPTSPGKSHDKKLADQQPLSYPRATTLGKDTGFQGYEPDQVFTFQPKKKPKGQELNLADKFFNRIFVAVRIQVEHTIAGVKRCRIVKDVLRNTKEGFSDLVMEVACALHNFRVQCRHPLPTFNLLDLCT